MIIIPYTHYEFQPPLRITQAEFESLKNINEVELKQLLTATDERERRAFIHARPVQHALTKFTFLTVVASLVCGLLLLGLYVTRHGDSIVSATWGVVLFAFCGSFFLAVVPAELCVRGRRRIRHAKRNLRIGRWFGPDFRLEEL